MKINSTIIEDTFSEAFNLFGARLWCTAISHTWAFQGATEATGNATSIIGCDVEAGVEGPASMGPDKRPGYRILFMTRNQKNLIQAVQSRVGQCLLTCPTVHIYDALDVGHKFDLGEWVRYFGNQYEFESQLKVVEGKKRAIWKIPVMDGHCQIETQVRVTQMLAGGVFMIIAENQDDGLAAADKAIKAMRELEGVIMPFPGGVVRAGSIVGSRYPGVPAATNDVFCPSLKDKVNTRLSDAAKCVYEIVVNGIDEYAVKKAMRAGILAACGTGVLRITSCHYDGKLGDTKIHIRDLLDE